MDRRLELQTEFEALLGSRNVYFQPPANVQMEFPAIVYNLDTMDTRFAGNNPYNFTKRYEVTVIDEDPDSIIPEKVAMLPMCVMSTRFVVDHQYHTVFNLYF